jgi:hypothetical protein
MEGGYHIMGNRMVEVFNQLTSSKLADCDTFKDIIKYHFTKFRYFYSLIYDIDTNKISRIDCVEHNNHLGVSIIVTDNKYVNDVCDTINKNTESYFMLTCFSLHIDADDDIINVTIKSTDIESESDNYANRFNKHR